METVTDVYQRLVDAAADAFDVGTFNFDDVVVAVLRELAAAEKTFGVGTLEDWANAIESGGINAG